MGQCAKAEEVGFNFICKRSRIRADFWIADFGRGGFESRFINVANAGDFETRIGMKGGGVMNTTLAHADDDDRILIHNALSNS